MNKKGFTLIELMLAMTLFISVLVVATTGFIGINKTFSKGIVRKQLSESVQRTVESMSQTYRNEGKLALAPLPLESGFKGYCGITTCYVWDARNDGSGMYKTKVNDWLNTQDGEKILDDKFKVQALDIEEVDDAPNLLKVRGVFRTNEPDAFIFDQEGDPYKTICKGSAQEGASRACALEVFSTMVRKAGVSS